ncbi:MAG: 16S rRNA (cytosine(1402)-N(4))-methyltransferase RsmH [Ruminococcaceae bacterium]|nr:16S rRNA (cytosine(1402)-N(4))-methyltransferase RsmH [Oscillospiraceae bacterium]
METTVFSHYSVLKKEVIESLAIRPDGIYVDCTAGGGGHSFEIASSLNENGRLIAIDRDDDAIRAAGKRLTPFADRVTMVKSNFTEVAAVLKNLGIDSIDGALIDLGVSSYQLDTAERGFSYMQDAPLDMRMDRQQTLTAYDVINGYSEAELKKILFTYGEEKFAPKIASAIVRQRDIKPIESTIELSELIKNALPAKAKVGGHHPAKRSFQAIRIEVNGELSAIEPTLRDLVSVLKPGGRLAVITFHSLEDRITKQTFASLCGACTCPPDFPVCVCGKKSIVRLPFKSLAPSETELEENPRSRSARLRVAEKL